MIGLVLSLSAVIFIVISFLVSVINKKKQRWTWGFVAFISETFASICIFFLVSYMGIKLTNNMIFVLLALIFTIPFALIAAFQADDLRFLQ